LCKIAQAMRVHGILHKNRDTAVFLEVEEASKEGKGAPLHPTSTISKKEEGLPVKTRTETKVQHIPLNQLRVGQRGVVVRVGGQGPARRRMMDMGLVPGSEVKVVRVAPLGDPIEFTVKGYSLSLRKSEAGAIEVEVTD